MENELGDIFNGHVSDGEPFEDDVEEQLTHEAMVNGLLDKHEQRLNLHHLMMEELNTMMEELNTMMEEELNTKIIKHFEIFFMCIVSGGLGSILTYYFQH